MTPVRAESIERALSTLLDALAAILIPLNVTPSRLDQLARTSFVRAGATHARKRSSGKPHIARIAALTGLSRFEVKRIVDANFRPRVRAVDSWPRAHRVLMAWRENGSYSSRAKPKRLRITGRAPCFATLCRLYSGDIPYQVILSELRRLGLVRVNRNKTHVSVTNECRKPTRAIATKHSLSFAAAFLADALKDDIVLLKRKQRIPAPHSVPIAYVESAIGGRVAELLDQMPKLFPDKKNEKRNVISVYALVARGKRKATKE